MNLLLDENDEDAVYVILVVGIVVTKAAENKRIMMHGW